MTCLTCLTLCLIVCVLFGCSPNKLKAIGGFHTFPCFFGVYAGNLFVNCKSVSFPGIVQKMWWWSRS